MSSHYGDGGNTQYKTEFIYSLIKIRAKEILGELKVAGIGLQQPLEFAKLLKAGNFDRDDRLMKAPESPEAYRKEIFLQLLQEFSTERYRDLTSAERLGKQLDISAREAGYLVHRLEHAKSSFRIEHDPRVCSEPPFPIEADEIVKLLAMREVLTKPLPPSVLIQCEDYCSARRFEDLKKGEEMRKEGIAHSSFGRIGRRLSRIWQTSEISKGLLNEQLAEMAEDEWVRKVLSSY